jgi:putative hydrolase of the HAD superfamily
MVIVPQSQFWIYTDADNTLWDTNAVFAAAQLRLLSEVENIAATSVAETDRLEFLRRYDQEIAKLHHARLRYPTGLLVRALLLGFGGLSPTDAASKALSDVRPLSSNEVQAVEKFKDDISKAPPILPGVIEGLAIARGAGIPVYVITEGPLERVKQVARILRLEEVIDGVLSATKSVELYRRLADRAYPRRAVMIGDQADRDIQLAHRAGLITILVRGAFQPMWISDDYAGDADTVAETFSAGIEWLVSSGDGRTAGSVIA